MSVLGFRKDWSLGVDFHFPRVVPVHILSVVQFFLQFSEILQIVFQVPFIKLARAISAACIQNVLTDVGLLSEVWPLSCLEMKMACLRLAAGIRRGSPVLNILET